MFEIVSSPRRRAVSAFSGASLRPRQTDQARTGGCFDTPEPVSISILVERSSLTVALMALPQTRVLPQSIFPSETIWVHIGLF